MEAPLLDVGDVSVGFGGVQALEEVSLAVPQGSIVGLIGPNGAGKTTLFNVVSGLVRPDTGVVRLAGSEITGLSTHRRAALGIGRSFQNLGLIQEESALVNVMAAQHLGARYQGAEVALRPWRWWSEERRLRRRALDALRTFGVVERAHDAVAELPFGTARFVELACVLVRDPRLMLLDEPTTGLDVTEIDELVVVLQQVREEGTSLFIVAHDVRFVMRVCDYTYVLTEGKILAEGSPDAVQANPLVIEAYLGRSA